MLRKATFFALAVVLVLGMVTMASAAQNVGNTSQKGSLLIFPKIWVDGRVDTYITIGNDYFEEVWVKCYWVDWDQNIEDFMFRLTPNQPVIFSAYFGSDLQGFVTVPPFMGGRGELKCWAVNAAGDQQISFNHLYGNAVIAQEDAGIVYNAWSFTARAPLKAVMGTGGTLLLTGAAGGYDACPSYLVTNFVPAFAPDPWRQGVVPDLTLVPCKQDLRQDRVPTCTKAKFDVWNENETKFTGAYVCLKCWAEGYLNEISPPYGFGGDKFTMFTLKTFAARFRVQSANNAACKASIPACASIPGVLTPFVGLMLYVDWETGLPWAGYEPFTAGADGTGFVLWDAQYLPQEAPGK
jgi:hypothetical protein